ncbi:putative aliphatic sulfonates transport permease protein ssuC [Carbonactinospora thermoautotrophica]|uniref:Putative aliphatic sulfonates transport permease protein ssuC n=1 Tax=Carbonactinospora thermoautotrophica TaxID=1469144 RepID=A0A132ML61_9ACTN|nr:putative aliphatic sulfonates transport permease protein ssuC [Carbonactinospora thermoautotrophica]
MASLLRPTGTEDQARSLGAGPEQVRAAHPANLRGDSRGRLLAVVLFTAAVKRTAAVAALLTLWEMLPRAGVVERTFLPPFSDVARAWWTLVNSGQLISDATVSLSRSLAGFGLAILLAIPLGLLIAWYKPVAQILSPLLEVFRNTAALALLPVFTLILGIGETSKIALVVYSCSWPILLNTISGVKEVDPLLVKSAKSMGLGSVRLFQKVILPGAVPTIFTGIRLAGAYSILILVAAEMVGAKAGLGYLINYAQFNFQIPQMYAGIITISAIGVVFNQGLLAVERRFSTWRNTATG